MKERKPIFYDAQRVRWRRTRRVLELSGALLTVLLAYFFITIAVSVDLPAGLLPGTKLGYHALKTKKRTQPVREGRRRRVANIGSGPASCDPGRAAFFVSWDPNRHKTQRARGRSSPARFRYRPRDGGGLREP